MQFCIYRKIFPLTWVHFLKRIFWVIPSNKNVAFWVSLHAVSTIFSQRLYSNYSRPNNMTHLSILKAIFVLWEKCIKTCLSKLLEFCFLLQVDPTHIFWLMCQNSTLTHNRWILSQFSGSFLRFSIALSRDRVKLN